MYRIDKTVLFEIKYYPLMDRYVRYLRHLGCIVHTEKQAKGTQTAVQISYPRA